MPQNTLSVQVGQNTPVTKAKNALVTRFNILLPILICAYLLFGLFTFVILKGDPSDWYALMRNDAEVALFAIYCFVGIVGAGAVFFFKKGPNLLGLSKKSLTASFLIAIIVGIAVFTYLNFTATQINYEWMHDGLVYQEMGQSFLSNGEFIVNGTFSHHIGPIYPIYLSAFYIFLPVHLATQVAVEIGFLLALATVFFITRKMYAVIPALITTALVATLPNYLFAASRNYAEPIVLTLFVITMYFILESLKPKKQNRIIVAGLTAALGYMVKSSFGYFFIIAGVGGFLWRFYYMRWGVLKNKNYLMAIVVFLSVIGAWTARNLYRFWDGTLLNLFTAIQPSDYMINATTYTFTKNIGGYFIELLFFTLLLGFFMLAYSWPFADKFKVALKRIRDERVSCLIVSCMLTLVLGLIITDTYFIYENSWMATFYVSYFPQQQVRYFLFNLVRYCFIALIPLSWLAYEIDLKSQKDSS
jgi:hypothetical protein